LEKEKNILEELFSSVLPQLKKYPPPPGNLEFNYLGIFQSLKLRISMEKILLISLKLNFTPNTLGCYGLKVRARNEYMNHEMSVPKTERGLSKL